MAKLSPLWTCLNIRLDFFTISAAQLIYNFTSHNAYIPRLPRGSYIEGRVEHQEKICLIQILPYLMTNSIATVSASTVGNATLA